MTLYRNNVKSGDKVKVVTDVGLYHIKSKELIKNFKCVYCLIKIISMTGCAVDLIDYKGIVKAETFLYYGEMEKINE